MASELARVHGLGPPGCGEDVVRAFLKVHDVPGEVATILGRTELPRAWFHLEDCVERHLVPVKYFRICHEIGLHRAVYQKTMTCCDDMRANRGLEAVLDTDSAGFHILAVVPNRDLSRRFLRVPLHYCPWCGKALGFSGTPLLTKADDVSRLFDKGIEKIEDAAYGEGYDEGYEDGRRDR